MKDFKDKVAVITGAASGIGRGIADRCVQEGMKVVLADVEESALAQAERELKVMGASVLAVQTDVSSRGDIEALAQKALDSFGAAHLLFNNAGIVAGSTIWESTLADWEWVVGVNLWGVIYGLRVFVPIMLAQDTECYIVNTASVAGLLPYHPAAPYQVAKHAVVALSEHLYHSLAQRNAKINASVLCPGWVDSRIVDSERNRPSELENEQGYEPRWQREIRAIASQNGDTAMSIQECVERIFNAVRAKQFYIITHPALNSEVQRRMENILKQQNPA